MKTAIDFFCGAGGLSLGFQQAGFKVIGGIDYDKNVQETYIANHDGAEFWLADIGSMDFSTLPKPDVVIGSPPCPEFSIANTRRNPEKGMELVRAFLHAIEELRPKMWVMENVPQAADYYPGWIPRVLILNAADFGTPQIRWRSVAGNYPMPRPTHARVPSNTLDGGRLLPWVTVRQAIGDLIEEPWKPSDWPKSFTKLYEYSIANTVAEWDSPGPTIHTGHGIPPIHPDSQVRVDGRAGYMKDGFNHDGRRSLDEPSFTIRGNGTRHGIFFSSESKRVVVSESIDDRPSTTIQADARLWPPGHHENRKIALRRLTPHECARLQGFPDSFKFIGTPTTKYRMIGNAVPPPLARALAEACLP